MDNANKPKVAILMGSKSDWDVMQNCPATLEKFGVPYELEVTSAHRSPERTAKIVRTAPERGVRVFVVINPVRESGGVYAFRSRSRLIDCAIRFMTLKNTKREHRR